MSSLVTANAVKERLLQDSDASDRKPQPATDDREIQPNGDTGSAKPQQLERYWARTLVLILIPPIVTAWYGVIWLRLVLGIEKDDAAKYRTFSGSLIYYSWFIIGVFGLSWSQYGLAGVEVAMLQSRFWRAPNLTALLMHSNTTWSSPSGWLKAIYHRAFYRLWCLLALLSVLPFIAFPLSGLVFESGNGYIGTSDHPFVIGRNATSYNNATQFSDKDAQTAWILGASPTIPGFGLVYTPPDVDRAEHSCLNQVPNTLPLTDSIPDMFLAPQAKVPVSGQAWGLRVKYNCSVVHTASEFTILGQKPVSIFSSVNDANEEPWSSVTLRTPSGDSINIFNSSISPGRLNMWSYAEMGWNEQTIRPTYEANGYNIAQSMVFEYALWQIQFRGYFDDQVNQTLTFNSTLGPTIEGMGSPFFMADNKTLVSNATFFKIRGGPNFTVPDPDGDPATLDPSITDLRDFFNPTDITNHPQPALDAAPPIGVRCVVSSGAGTATLHGVTSTFTDFERVDPAPDPNGSRGGVFGFKAEKILAWTEFSDYYKVAHLPREVPSGGLWRYQGYVPSPALLQAVRLAYGMDALERMYGVVAGFELGWTNANLTASREDKILGIASLIPGRACGDLVLALFCVWSGLSAVLGIVYGFRERPSDKLDGESMLRRGADMSEDLKDNGEVLSGRSFYKNETFKALPSS